MASEQLTTICNALRAVECPVLAAILNHVGEEGMLRSDEAIEAVATEVGLIAVALIAFAHDAAVRTPEVADGE
jgi:hypothetical protein